MTTSDLQFWTYAQFTGKLKTDPTQTKTFYISNRPILEDENPSRYLPLLIETSDIGLELDAYMPKTSVATLRIDNSPSSFGYERRLSDFLDRYTLTGQAISLYIADTALTDLDVTDDFEKVWQGSITTIQASPSGGELVISADSAAVDKRIVTKVIDSVQFPSADSTALGKHLPIVFGTDIQVRGVNVTYGATSPKFAYATTFADDFVIGGVQQYYAKAHDGEYSLVLNPAATSTQVIASTDKHGKTLNGWNEQMKAWQFVTNQSGTYVLKSATFSFDGGGGAANTAGSWFLGIWAVDKNTYVPIQRIAQVGILKATRSSDITGTSDFDVTFGFETPLVLNCSKYNYAYSTHTDDDSGTQAEPYYDTDVGPALAVYETSNNQWRSWHPSTGVVPLLDSAIHTMYFNAVKLTDSVTPGATEINSQGLGHAYVTATQASAPTGFTNPDLNRLDLVFEVDGFVDDGSGTITGSAGSTIVAPFYAAKLLTCDYTSGAWAVNSTDYDFTAHSATQAVNTSTHAHYRAIGGATSGRTSLYEIIEDICRNGIMRLTSLNSGKLAFWLWGSGAETSVKTISDEDAEVLSYEVAGPETIINRAAVYYNKKVIGAALVDKEGQYRDYGSALIASTQYSLDSLAAFGDRVPGDVTYNWIQDQASMLKVLKFLMTTYAFPLEYSVLRVPFFEYRALELLQAGTIIHPDLPAFYGTSSNPLVATYEGDPADAANGFPLKRAQSRRAHIEGKRITWGAGSYPTMTLTSRLLINPDEQT